MHSLIQTLVAKCNSFAALFTNSLISADVNVFGFLLDNFQMGVLKILEVSDMFQHECHDEF